MNVFMIGISHQTADIEYRERVSHTRSNIKKLLRHSKHLQHVSGAVILSTCNRTELYISSKICLDEIDLKKMFCEYFQVSYDDFFSHVYVMASKDVIAYLFELACGIHSMILGEDQIITQVKDALQLAIEEDASDATLNTLFRYAVTCAKKVKTEVALKAVSPSAAKQAVDILRGFIKSNPKCRALVIGNGEVGIGVCSELVSAGCEVYITLRAYKHSKTVVPYGCKTIDYEQRTAFMTNVDILISATASPHHTITYEMLSNINKKPNYIIDLAMPRDIDPKVKSYEDIIYYDIDSIGSGALKDNSNEIAAIKHTIKEQINKFNEWEAIRNCHRDIEEIKKYALENIVSGIDPDLCEKDKIEKAIIKTLELVFYSLKEDSVSGVTRNIINTVEARR